MSERTLTQAFLRAHLENMASMAQASVKYGLEATPAQLVDGMEGALLDLVRTSLPLDHLLATSDLVFHAEGPGVRANAPALSAFNWLSRATEAALRKLSGEMFDLSDRNAKQLGRALDLRLTGMAPGSLYLGIALESPPADMIPADDEPMFVKLRSTFRGLPEATTAIGDESINPEIGEMIPDAAERDAVLAALLRLSPTGRQGIHTLDVTSPGVARGTLSQRERVVLREAINHPLLVNRKSGAFVGEVREADLDKNRMHLRGVPGVGNLRCVLPAMDKSLFGETVRVSGEYESDRTGRPRLMLVNHVELVRPLKDQAELPA